MRFAQFATMCHETLHSRENTYRNAFKLMPNEAIKAFIIGKAYRVKALLEVRGSHEKILDDLKDLANYCYMYHVKKNGSRSFGDFMVESFLKNNGEFENTSSEQLADIIVKHVEKLDVNDNCDQTLEKIVVLAYFLAKTLPPSPFSSVRGNVEKYV